MGTGQGGQAAGWDVEYMCKSSSVFPLGTTKLNSADAVCIPGRGRIGAGQKVQKLGFW